MIDAERLTKDYGTVIAIKDVSFRVGRGEVVGFLGPNGAGKTTTLRIIAGFIGATSGRVRVNGFDIFEQSLEARRSIGYMPEAAPLYPEMRVHEYLTFRAAIKRVARGQRRSAVALAMRQAGVTDMAQTLIQHLSKGYRQRVGLADALVAAPPLLILDEPTAGLDPNQIREVRKLIRDLGKNHTIFLSTHILSEVETTCDRAIVIHRGRVVAEGSLDELRRHRRADTALLVVRDPEDRAQRLLESLPSVRQVRAERRDTELARLVVHYDEGLRDIASAVEAGVTALVGSGIGVREASLQKPTLEEVFAELTHSEDQKTDQVEAQP